MPREGLARQFLRAKPTIKLLRVRPSPRSAKIGTFHVVIPTLTFPNSCGGTGVPLHHFPLSFWLLIYRVFFMRIQPGSPWMLFQAFWLPPSCRPYWWITQSPPRPSQRFFPSQPLVSDEPISPWVHLPTILTPSRLIHGRRFSSIGSFLKVPLIGWQLKRNVPVEWSAPRCVLTVGRTIEEVIKQHRTRRFNQRHVSLVASRLGYLSFKFLRYFPCGNSHSVFAEFM